MEQVTFEKAVEGCSGEGRLAELSTAQEVSEVLRHAAALLEETVLRQGPFWVGLWKTKDKCVVSHLPLQGFRWVSDDSERWEGGPLGEGAGPWWKKPDPTCTTTGCASLSVRGLRWGLLQGNCRVSFAFICQRTLEHTATPIVPLGAAATQTPPSFTTTPILLDTTPPDTTPPSLATPTLPGTSRTSKPPPGPQAPGGRGAFGDPVPETRPCPTPSIPKSRWVRWELESVGLLTVKCWSGPQRMLNCSDDRWELDGVVVLDLAGVCNGSQTGAPPPPYPRDVWAGPLVPVLVAVAVLVVLVVLALVAVRCCWVRRSKDRAVRRAEKMALKNAAGGKDSMENSSKA